VNSIEPPDFGEIRIADTKCHGFGLRVWRTSKGVGRAFDLRARDASKRYTRRTYRPRHGSPKLALTKWEYLRGTFGFYLEGARGWAEEQRFKIVGLPTPREEEQAEREVVYDKAVARSLRDNAESFLSHGRSGGWSQAYCDGIDELLHLLPSDILDAPLAESSQTALSTGLLA
jgi:hypothetical protein